MATNIFDGSTDGDVTDGDNWSLAVIPANDDDVIFPASVTGLTITGDMTAGGTIAISTLVVENLCPLTFGTAGAPVQVDVGGAGASTVNIDGRGEAHWDIDNAALITYKGTASTVSVIGLDNVKIVVDSSFVNMTLGDGGATTTEFDTIVVKAANKCFISAAIEDVASAGWADLEITGGTVESFSKLDTVTQYGGTWTHFEEEVVTLFQLGGSALYKSAGTITTLSVRNGSIDLSGDQRAVTVTTATCEDGTVLDPDARVTWTNDLELTRSSIPKCTLDLGRDITLAVS